MDSALSASGVKTGKFPRPAYSHPKQSFINGQSTKYVDIPPFVRWHLEVTIPKLLSHVFIYEDKRTEAWNNFQITAIARSGESFVNYISPQIWAHIDPKLKAKYEKQSTPEPPILLSPADVSFVAVREEGERDCLPLPAIISSHPSPRYSPTDPIVSPVSRHSSKRAQTSSRRSNTSSSSATTPRRRSRSTPSYSPARRSSRRPSRRSSRRSSRTSSRRSSRRPSRRSSRGRNPTLSEWRSLGRAESSRYSKSDKGPGHSPKHKGKNKGSSRDNKKRSRTPRRDHRNSPRSKNQARPGRK